MRNSFSISGMGNSLLHWANYLCDVNRGHILNEGSIKYAISEFLEVFSGKTDYKSTSGAIKYVKQYKFEQVHPYYKGRRLDLMIEYSEAGKADVCQLYFEFKHVTETSIYEHEYKRYLNDLIRLFSFHINKGAENVKTYFMVFGKNATFTECFKRDLNPTYDKLLSPYTIDFVHRGNRNTNQNFSKILDIYSNKEVTINLNEFKYPEESPDLYIDLFESDYEKKEKTIHQSGKNKSKSVDVYKDANDNHVHVRKNDVIKTKLVFPEFKVHSEDSDSPVSVYIWEVYKD